MVFQSHDFSGSYVKLRGVIVCLFFEGEHSKRLEWNFVTQRNWENLPKEILGGHFHQFHTHFLDEFISFLSFGNWLKEPPKLATRLIGMRCRFGGFCGREHGAFLEWFEQQNTTEGIIPRCMSCVTF